MRLAFNENWERERGRRSELKYPPSVDRQKKTCKKSDDEPNKMNRGLLIDIYTPGSLTLHGFVFYFFQTAIFLFEKKKKEIFQIIFAIPLLSFYPKKKKRKHWEASTNLSLFGSKQLSLGVQRCKRGGKKVRSPPSPRSSVARGAGLSDAIREAEEALLSIHCSIQLFIAFTTFSFYFV